MEYITASCVISEQAVYRNGRQVFPVVNAAEEAETSAERPPAARPQTSAAAAAAPAGLLSSLYHHFDWQYAKYFRMDHLSRLGFAAAEILLQGWDAKAYRPEDIAIVLSNANSSLDTDYRYSKTTREIPSPGVFVYTLPNIVIGEISIRHHFQGENAFFLSETFDAGLLTKYVSYLLTRKIARVCLTGWVELLGDHVKAALFLIEEKVTADAPVFSTDNLNRIFTNPTA